MFLCIFSIKIVFITRLISLVEQDWIESNRSNWTELKTTERREGNRTEQNRISYSSSTSRTSTATLHLLIDYSWYLIILSQYDASLKTNFMLCKMEDEGASYGAALKGEVKHLTSTCSDLSLLCLPSLHRHGSSSLDMTLIDANSHLHALLFYSIFVFCRYISCYTQHVFYVVYCDALLLLPSNLLNTLCITPSCLDLPCYYYRDPSPYDIWYAICNV